MFLIFKAYNVLLEKSHILLKVRNIRSYNLLKKLLFQAKHCLLNYVQSDKIH